MNEFTKEQKDDIREAKIAIRNEIDNWMLEIPISNKNGQEFLKEIETALLRAWADVDRKVVGERTKEKVMKELESLLKWTKIHGSDISSGIEKDNLIRELDGLDKNWRKGFPGPMQTIINYTKAERERAEFFEDMESEW